MSATTTTTTSTAASLFVLADYEVHHSGFDHNNDSAAPVNAHQLTWPADHRRVPAYRPINRDLDFAERPAGNGSYGEYAFIQVMLHGVWLNAAVSRLWRFTGGQVNDKIFHYEIGGEW